VESHAGYWNLDKIQVQIGNDEEINLGSTGIYAPFRFSYHCSIETVFGNQTGASSLTFQDFQVCPNTIHFAGIY